MDNCCLLAAMTRRAQAPLPPRGMPMREETNLIQLRNAALVAAMICSLAGCTSGMGNVLGTTPGATGTTPTGSTGTTPTSTTPTSTTPTTSGSTSTTAKGHQTATGTCTSSTPAATPDVVPNDSSMGEFANQHVPNGWADQYTTEEAMWNAFNTMPDAQWACVPSFYGGAYKAYNDLKSKYGQ